MLSLCTGFDVVFCRWVQSQCQSLTDVDVAEVHPLLSSALIALKARPVLLRYCSEEVATARHSAIFNAFLVALTQGAPRPIEMHAHNPRSVNLLLPVSTSSCNGSLCMK